MGRTVGHRVNAGLRQVRQDVENARQTARPILHDLAIYSGELA